MNESDRVGYCPCTGRQTLSCSCSAQVQEHYALKGRVKLAKRLVMASLAVAAVVVTVALSGCHTAPQSKGITTHQGGPNISFEGDAGLKHEVCMNAALEAARNTPDITDEYLPAAKDLYWTCMRDLGGAI